MPRVKTRTFLVLSIITILCLVFICFWSEKYTIVTTATSNRQLVIRNPTHNKQENAVILDHSMTWNRSLSSLLEVTKERPWFMSNGHMRPNNRLYPYHSLPLWPDQDSNSDRIVNQLMYMPKDYDGKSNKLKKILLFFVGRT